MKHGHKRPLSLNSDNQAQATENLRRTVELTELGLPLRQAVIREQDPTCDAMKQEMHEIRLAKERAWRQNPS
jgi:hypothetical protein